MNEPNAEPEETAVQHEIQTLDPLLFDLALPLRALYYPLGFAVAIQTNSPDVLAAAQESWGHFRQRHAEPPLEMRVGVTEGKDDRCPPPPVWRGYRHLLTQTADAENSAVCDSRQGTVFTWLTRAAVGNRAYLRYHFLEGAIWVLLDCMYLTPLHAACVSYGGRGVLLCGDSGAGKSSLAYACARHGWTFLSDDSSYLIRGRQGARVAGNPFQMRFRTSAVGLFPELARQPITPQLSGEMAIELPTASVPEIVTAAECAVEFIVFLNRKDPAPPALAPMPSNQAMQWLSQFICYGEARIRDAQRAALGNLLAARTFELRYERLDWAVHRLEALMQESAAPLTPSLAALQG